MLIKKFSDGSLLEFDQGKFDKWCIFLTRPSHKRIAPKDIQYFNGFVKLASKYDSLEIYSDFVTIYNRTTNTLNPSVLELIHILSFHYEPDHLNIELLLTIVYAGMIAEENKNKAILKKKIKRLAMHQILVDKLAPEIAANFSRGKNWKELELECKKRGF